MRKYAFLCIALLFVFNGASLAQSIDNFHRWTLKFGGGVTPPVGESHNRLTTGWHFVAGGGINFTKRLALLGEYQYNGLGVTSGVIQQLGVPGADSHVMSVTVDPVFKFSTGRIQPYVIGGIGWYRRTVNLTQPSAQLVSFFDPFFGFVSTAVPTTQILGTISRDAFGGNIGGGVNVPFSGGSFFAEIRYHDANTPRTATQILPVTVGFRW